MLGKHGSGVQVPGAAPESVWYNKGMKLLFTFVLFLGAATAQNPPATLPTVNTVSIAGVTCTFTVTDSKISLSVDCVASDGTVLDREIHTPSPHGTLVGGGPISCLYGNHADGYVMLQCAVIDEANAVTKIVLDGKLAPVTKKRQWWLFWR